MFDVLVATYIEITGVLLLNDSHSAQAEPYYYCLTREVPIAQWLLSDWQLHKPLGQLQLPLPNKVGGIALHLHGIVSKSRI